MNCPERSATRRPPLRRRGLGRGLRQGMADEEGGIAGSVDFLKAG
jgi:hypothetical protein